MEISGNNNRRKDEGDTYFTKLFITGMVSQNLQNKNNTRHVERSTDTQKMSAVHLLGKRLRLLAIKVIMKLVRKY